MPTVLRPFASTGSRTAFRFAGKAGYVTDDHSGLDLLGRRYYIPALGRFLTQDPKGHGAGLNLYRYCDDNPLTNLDPTGLDKWAIIAGDTEWPACIMWQYYNGFAAGLESRGQSVKSYNGPSQKTVIDIMCSNVNDVLFWGHGNKSFLFYGHEWNDHLETKDVLSCAATRHAMGLSKMKSIEIDECNALSDENLVNALLQVADKVIGYEGETALFGQIGIKRTYTKPYAHPKGMAKEDGMQNYFPGWGAFSAWGTRK